jgi:hypothetical protein
VDLSEAAAATVSAVPDESRNKAVAYVHEHPLGAGTVLLVDRRPEVLIGTTYLGFVDCEPGKNWGHRCRYVRCGVDDGTVEVTEAQFPPALEHGHLAWVAQFVGPEVPVWAVIPRSDRQ